RKAGGGEALGAMAVDGARGVGMGSENEAAHGCTGRAGFKLEAYEGQERLGVAGGSGQGDGARVAAVGIELYRDFEAGAGKSAEFQAREQTLEGSVGEKEKRLEGGERPLEVHA